MFRIAPSPTGELHCGNLFNIFWVKAYALQYKGNIILRIDDTDDNINSNLFADKIISLVSDLNINIDQVIFQSKRINIYNLIIEEMLRHNYIYYCKCSRSKSLECVCRNNCYTSGALRFDYNNITAIDKSKGNIKANQSDSVILVRSNGKPTYHIASCIDDFLFNIHTIIRADEWVPKTNLHKAIFNTLNKLFGLNYDPNFFHLPILLDKEKHKLSKSNNATSVRFFFEEMKILPAALENYLLSISSKNMEKEIFESKDLFLDSIRTSPAIFNLDKLLWFNKLYLRNMKIEDLKTFILKFYPQLDKYDYFYFDIYLKIIKNKITSIDKIYNDIAPAFKNIDYFLDNNVIFIEQIDIVINLIEKDCINEIKSKLINIVRFSLIGSFLGIERDIIFNCFSKEILINKLLALKYYVSALVA